MSSTDGCGSSLHAYYDLHFHISSLFILLGCSLCGTSLPVLGKKFPSVAKCNLPFACGKLFGTGVILSTAFIHMLLPANDTLSSPCLPSVINSYPFAGVACLAAILFTQMIQFFVSLQVENSNNNIKEITPLLSPTGDNIKDHDHEHVHDHGHGLILKSPKRVSVYILEVGILSHSIIIGIALGLAREPAFKPLVIALAFHQFFEGLALSTVVVEANDDIHDLEDPFPPPLLPSPSPPSSPSSSPSPSSSSPSSPSSSSSSSPSSPTFRYASFSHKKTKKTMMTTYLVAFIYTFATPIGIAIGIATNESFNENSDANLLAQGFLDAVSAGILIYDALVNILGPHFEDSKFKNSKSNFSRLAQIFSLWLGTGVMAVIGKWA